MCSEKSHMRSSPRSEISPTSSLKQFQCLSNWQWPSLVRSGRLVQRLLIRHLSPPGDRWCDVLGFVPAGSVWSSSTLQIFRDTSHLWCLLFPPVYLLGNFPSLQHVQGSTSTKIFEGGCRPLTNSSLGLAFHFFKFYFSLKFLLQAHLNCEGDGMCGLTVTSWGNPADGMSGLIVT